MIPNLDVALAERMKSPTALEVVSAATLVTLEDKTKIILVIHQALCDESSNQTEALLQPHQCRAHGVAIDDCAKRHQHIDGSHGEQCIQVLDSKIPLFYDGFKCYISTSNPTLDEFDRYPQLELTSPLLYEPDKRVFTRRRRAKNVDNVKEWRAKLGYLLWRLLIKL